ncbi:MAG: DUF882 domain-containing protein, partial [Deltaproteobacteria bacterium]|nr:DUF882 domain-containing protein [Deltaproteobacteria bacterium]MBW2535231.1 DUF882 domain-containing protein [Deltaproteobacteria bacterium]
MLLLGLLIGTARTSSAKEVVHVVASGHTLGAIARRYLTTVEAIEKRNDLAPGQHIHPGQELRIVVPDDAPRPKAPQRAKRRGRKRPRQTSAKHSLDFATAALAAGPAAEQVSSLSSWRGTPRAGATGSTRRRRGAPASPTEALLERYRRKPPKPGHVTIIRFSERFSGPLVDARRRVIPAAHARVSRILRDLRTRQVVPIDRRLLRLLADVSDHFGGRPIVVVSGFRMYTASQHTSDSRHNYGQALDFRIVGVPNEALRSLCLKFDEVGVGYYPNSTFVHLDTRSYNATWVDTSGPGQRPRYVTKRNRRRTTGGTRPSVARKAPRSSRPAGGPRKAAAPGATPR